MKEKMEMLNRDVILKESGIEQEQHDKDWGASYPDKWEKIDFKLVHDLRAAGFNVVKKHHDLNGVYLTADCPRCFAKNGLYIWCENPDSRGTGYCCKNKYCSFCRVHDGEFLKNYSSPTKETISLEEAVAIGKAKKDSRTPEEIQTDAEAYFKKHIIIDVVKFNKD